MLIPLSICKLVQLSAEGGAVRRFILGVETAGQLEHYGGAFQMRRPIVLIEAHGLRKAPSVVESEVGGEALGRAADVTVKGLRLFQFSPDKRQQAAAVDFKDFAYGDSLPSYSGAWLPRVSRDAPRHTGSVPSARFGWEPSPSLVRRVILRLRRPARETPA